MREIKFRAWDMNDKSWVNYSEESNRYDRGIADFFESRQPFYRFNRGDIVLMQFTGLKDKNGVEIHEGDIVRVANYQTDWKRGEPDFDWRVFEIQWNRYTWAFNNSVMYSPLSDYDTGTADPYDIEVIGNIYENPELLK